MTSPITVVISFVVLFVASILWATHSNVASEHPAHGEASPEPGKRS